MRTTSSFRFVGELFPPMKVGSPPALTVLEAGKIPAFSSDVALGEIMQEGMVLLGKGAPCTMPAGRRPPGQFRARTVADMADALGTLIAWLPKSPPLVEVAGTG